MSLLLSSTASVEARQLRRAAVIGSTEIEPTARSAAVVPRSAETPRIFRRSGDLPFAPPENFQAALAQYLADVDAVAGIVTCRNTGRTGLWIFESPTLRLTAEPFQPAGRFGTVPVEWTMREQCVRLRGTSFATVTTVHTVAPPITRLPSLLSSTDPAFGAPKLVAAKFAEAVALAAEEWFEDGIESAFSRTLSTLVHTYGNAAVAAVETFLNSPTANIEVAVEAAQSLGEIDHRASHRYRKSLLEKLLLDAPSTRLRHGAAAGLAAMNDISSLSTLMEARDRETNRRLRHFLELVVDQLERTRACRG